MKLNYAGSESISGQGSEKIEFNSEFAETEILKYIFSAFYSIPNEKKPYSRIDDYLETTYNSLSEEEKAQYSSILRGALNEISDLEISDLEIKGLTTQAYSILNFLKTSYGDLKLDDFKGKVRKRILEEPENPKMVFSSLKEGMGDADLKNYIDNLVFKVNKTTTENSTILDITMSEEESNELDYDDDPDKNEVLISNLAKLEKLKQSENIKNKYEKIWTLGFNSIKLDSFVGSQTLDFLSTSNPDNKKFKEDFTMSRFKKALEGESKIQSQVASLELIESQWANLLYVNEFYEKVESKVLNDEPIDSGFRKEIHEQVIKEGFDAYITGLLSNIKNSDKDSQEYRKEYSDLWKKIFSGKGDIDDQLEKIKRVIDKNNKIGENINRTALQAANDVLEDLKSMIFAEDLKIFDSEFLDTIPMKGVNFTKGYALSEVLMATSYAVKSSKKKKPSEEELKEINDQMDKLKVFVKVLLQEVKQDLPKQYNDLMEDLENASKKDISALSSSERKKHSLNVSRLQGKVVENRKLNTQRRKSLKEKSKSLRRVREQYELMTTGENKKFNKMIKDLREAKMLTSANKFSAKFKKEFSNILDSALQAEINSLVENMEKILSRIDEEFMSNSLKETILREMGSGKGKSLDTGKKQIAKLIKALDTILSDANKLREDSYTDFMNSMTPKGVEREEENKTWAKTNAEKYFKAATSSNRDKDLALLLSKSKFNGALRDLQYLYTYEIRVVEKTKKDGSVSYTMPSFKLNTTKEISTRLLPYGTGTDDQYRPKSRGALGLNKFKGSVPKKRDFAKMLDTFKRIEDIEDVVQEMA